MESSSFEYSVADVHTNSQGRKFAQLLPAFVHQTTTPTLAPFGTSNFDKSASASRLTLDINVDSDTAAAFAALDAWAVPYLAQNSERLFGTAMSNEQIAAMYRPCLRRKEGYSPLLHCKVTAEGHPHATRWWSESKGERGPPANWRDEEMLFRLSAPHLWLSSGMCGFVVNVVDAQIFEVPPRPRVCPF